MTFSASIEDRTSAKEPRLASSQEAHRAVLSLFAGLAALWIFEAAAGLPGVRPLVPALAIGGLAALLCYAWTKILGEPRGLSLASLAYSSSAALLPVFFLPEYILGGHVWPIRSVILVLLAAGLCLVLRAWKRHASEELREELRARLAVRRSIAASLFLAAYFALAVFASVRKYEVLGYAGQDLAYFSQIFYTTVHGRLFNSNFYQDLLYSHSVQSDFAGHNSPIQYLFVFFYRLFPSPATLLVVRDAIITLCAIPAYRLARNWFSPRMSIALAALFLLTPAILFQDLFEFYPFSLAAFFLLFAFDFYARKQFVLFCFALIATLLVREDLVFALFALGVLGLWQRRAWKWSLVPLCLAVFWAVLSWRYVLPHFLQGAPFRSNVCFCHLGATPAEMWSNIRHQPTRYILTRDNLVYLKQLSAPFGFVLSWLNPIALGALPYLAINLLGGAGECPTASIFSQHAVVPTAFLFAGFVWSVAWLRRKSSGYGIAPADTAFTVVAFALALALADLAFAVYPEQYSELRSKPYVDEAQSIARLIPADAAVAAPRYMAPLLANRMSLYMTDDLFDYHHPDPAFVIVDRDFARMKRTPKWRAMYDRVTAFLEHDAGSRIVYSTPNYIVYRRTAESRPLDRQAP